MHSPTRANNKVGRPADRTNGIACEIRRRIVAGELTPGMRLPPRAEFEAGYAASPVTVQRALAQLVSEGFIRVDRTVGTFVAERPPHLFRYGLVFAERKPDPGGYFNRHYASLLRASREVAAGRGVEIEAYFGLDGHVDGEDHARLIEDVNANRLAGLIFASPPPASLDTTVILSAALPRVRIGGCRAEGMPVVTSSHHEFLDLGLDALRAAGRGRVAMFLSCDLPTDGIEERIRARGLLTRPHWILPCNIRTPHTVKRVVELLMSRESTVVPDALLIDDDNLVEPAVAGFIEAGVRIPADVQLVVFANLPWTPSSVVPLQYIGVDSLVVLEACLDCLQKQSRGEASLDLITIPNTYALPAGGAGAVAA